MLCWFSVNWDFPVAVQGGRGPQPKGPILRLNHGMHERLCLNHNGDAQVWPLRDGPLTDGDEGVVVDLLSCVILMVLVRICAIVSRVI